MSAVAGDEHHDDLPNGTHQASDIKPHEPSKDVSTPTTALDIPSHDEVTPLPKPVTTHESSEPLTATDAADTNGKESSHTSVEHSIPQVRQIVVANQRRVDEHDIRTWP